MDRMHERLTEARSKHLGLIKANAELANVNGQHLEENIRLSARLEEALDTKAAQAAKLKELRRREKTVWLVLLKAANRERSSGHTHRRGCRFCEAIQHVEEALGDYDDDG